MKNRGGARNFQTGTPTYEISIENGARPSEIIEAPPSATRETARHVRNWKATDVDNVSGIKAGAGYRERIRIREKCKGGKQAPPLSFCFLCKFYPRREVKPNREHDIFQIFFRFQFFFFCFNVSMLIFSLGDGYASITCTYVSKLIDNRIQEQYKLFLNFCTFFSEFRIPLVEYYYYYFLKFEHRI